jgi:hypothetical protein
MFNLFYIYLAINYFIFQLVELIFYIIELKIHQSQEYVINLLVDMGRLFSFERKLKWNSSGKERLLSWVGGIGATPLQKTKVIN